jgi:hypothetical protein
MGKLKPKYTLEERTSKFLENFKSYKIKKKDYSNLKIDELKKLSPKVVDLILADSGKFGNKLFIKKKEVNVQIIKEYIQKRERKPGKSMDLNKENKILIKLLATKDASITDTINILNYFNKFKTNTQKYGFIYYILNNPEYNASDILKRIKMRGDNLENVDEMYKLK